MVLVLGFWTFLRAVFFGSAVVALENVAVVSENSAPAQAARW
jgi:hypothetical protein